MTNVERKNLRQEMNMTQEQFANMLNITKSAWCRKEKGDRAIKVDEANKILRKYYELTGKYINLLTLKPLEIKE